MGDIFGGGGGTTVVNNTTPPPTPEETALISLYGDLARRQLANVDALAPFQKELLDLSLAEMKRQAKVSQERDAIMTPERIKAQAEAEERINELSLQSLQQEAERSTRLGPVQDELLQLQLEQLRSGGAATPAQEARIKEATDAGILAGSGDIDASTQRGIGLIADELANSRGLRLSDSPIKGEAALLAREGEIQKGSLIRNLRSAGASAKLNYPLAVQQMQSGIALTQQQLAGSATQFQADLRQRAYQNRLALTGQAGSTGIGLASINDGGRAISALSNTRMANSSSTTNSPGAGINIGQIGQLAGGIGALAAFSDRGLKDDYGVVAVTKGGIPLHIYKYKGEGEGDPLRLGVMADEMEQVNPDAVKRHSSGFKVVDYAAIR